jgi:RNA polymerase sigma-70 factor (ECF subfamily)
LYSLIVAILGDSRDAEEVLQELFLQIWKQASRYDRRKGSVYKWLVTLARCRAIDRTRSRNFTQRREMETLREHLDDESSTSQTTQLDAFLMLERAEVVRAVLAKIPATQQQVMHLAYFLGHTQSEIARKLEIPLGTVKTRMRQGLITLRGLLAQELEP